MSGKLPDGTFDLTPTKAKFYLRRSIVGVPPGVDPVSHFLASSGLSFTETSWGGWNVQASQGQIWSALSGEAADPKHYQG